MDSRNCRKPNFTAVTYLERRGDMHVVLVHYDNGRTGELDIPVDRDKRDSVVQRMYERQMVFGRHHWDRKSPEEYAALENAISAALPD
ncbi:MAG: hypothetical protein HRF49_00060 [bacterium]|jgi:hypothetical protein